MVAAAAAAGLGIALLPALFAEEASGALEPVLPHLQSPEMWIVAAYPDRALSTAARTFVDFLAARFDPSALDRSL